MKYREGDIVYSKIEQEYYVYKVLRTDEEYKVYHILTYEPMDRVPQVSDIPFLQTYIGHAPVSTFDGILLSNEPVLESELKGYLLYLKQVDFAGWLKETGQDPEVVIATANDFFYKAYALTDEKKYDEAIDYYTQAFELFPLFHEAMDNRAFVKMDMGKWLDAIADFQISLSVFPVSTLAEFSIGECYLNMGAYVLAIEQFDKALAIDPEDRLSIEFKAKALVLMKG